MRQKNQKRIAQTILQELQDLEQSPTKYKVLSYDVADQLEKVELYDDAGLTQKLFTKDLTYSGGLLSQMVITRERDSATATKDFTYSGGLLSQVDLT